MPDANRAARCANSRHPEIVEPQDGIDNTKPPDAIQQPEPDLFGYEPKAVYPAVPGSKSGGTSRLASYIVAPTARNRRAEALASFLSDGPATADEIAQRLGYSVLAIRPRCAELHAMKLIVPTGERRPSSTGMPSTVWRAAAGAR